MYASKPPASLNAMDGVNCPDGCTREPESVSQPHAPEAGDSICLLCLGGVDSSVQQDLSPGDVVLHGVGLEPLAHHLDAPPDRVERPPRS